MGLFFTLLYIFSAYLSPVVLFGSLTEYRVGLIIAIAALLASIPSLPNSGLFRIPQTYAVFGLSIAVICSLVFSGWFGSASDALLTFLPTAFTFFLVFLNCKKKSHLQMVVAVLVIVSLFVVFNGWSALHAEDFHSLYLVGQDNTQGAQIYRLRGLASINDPNDLSQLFASVIPCMFLFWRPKKILTNALFVYIPAAILVYGMYLTHSRGGMIALLAVIVFAARRKIGVIPSFIVGGALFALTMAIGWSGGRDVSVEAGADRMEAWSAGLQFIKSHPIFGIGFERFSDLNPITAHNSIVVCAAELGLFGFLIWTLYTLVTVRDTFVLGSAEIQEKNSSDDPADTILHSPTFTLQATASAPLRNKPALAPVEAANITASAIRRNQQVADAPYYATSDTLDNDPQQDEDIHRMARILSMCLIGFLVAGWFLSRAYVMALFIYGGMIQVIYRMALNRGIAPPRMPALAAIRMAVLGAIALLAIVYIWLRVAHLMGA